MVIALKNLPKSCLMKASLGKTKLLEKRGLQCCQEITLQLIALTWEWQESTGKQASMPACVWPKRDIPFPALIPQLCLVAHVALDHPALSQPLQGDYRLLQDTKPHCNTLILITTPIYHKITVSQGCYYPTGGV